MVLGAGTPTWVWRVVVLLAALASGGHAFAQPGSVLSHQKISDTEGGFEGMLSGNGDCCELAALGDLDGDGVPDLAVGAPADDDGGLSRGAVWVLFLNADGTVKDHQKISDTEGGFVGGLADGDSFGRSIVSLGDVDGDTTPDLAVGASGDDDGGTNRGAVWVLLLNADGTVKDQQKISDTEGGFGGILDNFDEFGRALSSLDANGDGVMELAVGASGDDDGGQSRGAVWLLFLNTDGTVSSHQKISDTEGGFAGTLNDVDRFGRSVASLGDFDGDGAGDLVVGALADDDGGSGRGAVWLLFLNTDGTVSSHQKISDTQGGFTGILDDSDNFGSSVHSLVDLDGDGVSDLAVGAAGDDDGGENRGAVWVLFLQSDGTIKAHRKISDTAGGFTGLLDDDDEFYRVASLDVDGDGVPDLAVGAPGDDDGGQNKGAVWVLFLEGRPCGNAGAGDCCVANGTAGCDRSECCAAVCATEPLCCEPMPWDDLCAAIAAAHPSCECSQNPVCPGTGFCLMAHGTPGCDDDACCNIVCSLRPECCSMGWDSNCVGLALMHCNLCEAGCGKLNVECLDLSPPQYNNRTAVGNLRRPNGTCTGWIIAAPDLIMTNRHCITEDGLPFGQLIDITTVSIEFNFECLECEGILSKPITTFDVVELIHDRADLDYAILRVAGDPALDWGVLSVDDAEPVANEQIYEIHHSLGDPKGFDYDQTTTGVVHSDECDFGTTAEFGIATVSGEGASGSPIFRASNDCVIGICHCGEECGQGFAIPMSAILPDALPHILSAGGSPCFCCTADLNGDNSVGIIDFLALLTQWGPCPLPPMPCPADLNHDGEVGIVDFLALLADWGPCLWPCGPLGPPGQSLQQEIEDAGLVWPDDWDTFVDCMTNGTEEEQNNCNCWMTHYLHGCIGVTWVICSQPACPGADPFAPPAVIHIP